jgi:vacuolar protein sorting-associated protein IST1
LWFGVSRECSEDISEAAAGIMFAARWCGDLPELLLARTILEDKFGSYFAVMSKEGTGIVDPMVMNPTLFVRYVVI